MKDSRSKVSEPMEFREMLPEEFLRHAEDLVKFEWGRSARAPSNSSEPHISSLERLATDGLEELKSDSLSEDDMDDSEVDGGQVLSFRRTGEKV